MCAHASRSTSRSRPCGSEPITIATGRSRTPWSNGSPPVTSVPTTVHQLHAVHRRRRRVGRTGRSAPATPNQRRLARPLGPRVGATDDHHRAGGHRISGPHEGVGLPGSPTPARNRHDRRCGGRRSRASDDRQHRLWSRRGQPLEHVITDEQELDARWKAALKYDRGVVLGTLGNDHDRRLTPASSASPTVRGPR